MDDRDTSGIWQITGKAETSVRSKEKHPMWEILQDEEYVCLHLLDFLHILIYLRLKGIFFIKDREHRLSNVPIIALNKEVWHHYVHEAVNEVLITAAWVTGKGIFRCRYFFWAVCQRGGAALFMVSDSRTLSEQKLFTNLISLMK